MGRINRATLNRGWEAFEVKRLLEAIEEIEAIRAQVTAGPDGQPPAVQAALLRLHSLAHTLLHDGAERAEDDDLCGLASALEATLYALWERINTVLDTVEDLMALAPTLAEDTAQGAVTGRRDEARKEGGEMV